jgi:hypothetical protein
MKRKTFKVSARQARITIVGRYRVVPHMHATKHFIFFRVYKGTKAISDHGDRQGAVLAAKSY